MDLNPSLDFIVEPRYYEAERLYCVYVLPNRTASKTAYIYSSPGLRSGTGVFIACVVGFIRTTVSSHCAITPSGDLELNFDIRNKGNVTAHKTAVTLTLFDSIRCYPDLGENAPDGNIALEDEIECPGWKSGVYVGVVEVAFEEQNGNPHIAYHFFTVKYRMKGNDLPLVPLQLWADPPVFNRKAFWNRKKSLKLILKNCRNTAITPDLSLYLPEGFTSPGAGVSPQLLAEDERVIMIPVFRSANAKSNKTLHLIANYEFNELHYALHLKKTIQIEGKPVFFKAYLVVCSAIILILWAFLMFFGHGKTVAKRTADHEN